jgi:hypothetical protein
MPEIRPWAFSNPSRWLYVATRLKRLLADAELDKAMLKELAEGNF